MRGHVASVPGAPLIAARNIVRSFGGVRALKNVSIDIRPGEVHGLVGANGAGKSTLIRILAGLDKANAGQIELDGQTISIDSAHAATMLGLSFIHQELALVPSMTVLENIMLGSAKKTRFGMVDWKSIARDVAPVAARVGLNVPFSTDCRHLSPGENWLVSICRALVHQSRLIVMDEPTASLSPKEAERLFSIIRDLSASGVAVLYVSHRLDEILDLCDRVTVFRDGQSISTLNRAELSRERLVSAIVGGDTVVSETLDHSNVGRDVVLVARGLCRKPKLASVSFNLHRGEVLGIGGLVGSGRSELMRLIFGADRMESGSLTLGGANFRPVSPADAVRAGIGFVPEERRVEGLVLTRGVAFNIGIGNLGKLGQPGRLPLLNKGARAALAADMIRALQIKVQDIDAPVGRLSGGNQQKVVIGRWLARRPDVLILDEPTRGVDIGARGEIHRLLRDLVRQGMSIIVVSSEPDELPDLCDRVLVMAEGRIVRELNADEITRGAIVQASYEAIY